MPGPHNRAPSTAPRRRPRRARVAGRAPFVEQLPPISTANPLDAWGGWAGELESLYLTTGERKGGTSQVWRLHVGTTAWVPDGAPTGPTAETINKIRSGLGKIWAYYERPGSGQTWLISKSESEAGPGGWSFEGVSSHGGPVGGRGLAIDGAEGEAVFGGTTQNVNATGPHDGEVYEGPGSWGLHRLVTPSLMWELEFDGSGNLWEFFSDFNNPANVADTFVGGVSKGAAPGRDISHAAWFPTTSLMYVTGNLAGGGPRNTVSASASGDTWATVLTFSEASFGDHVLYVPRGEGEFWAVGANPLEAHYTLDGSEWVREDTLPSFGQGDDTNHLTAIAYWQDGVWIFARDDAAGVTRVFRDAGVSADLMLQVI